VSWPGPAPLPWGIALLAFGGALLPLGDALRTVLARWSRLLRTRDPIERGIVSLYLAGGTFYVVGSLPLGLFLPGTPAALVLGGIVAWVVLRLPRVRRHLGATDEPARPNDPRGNRVRAIVLAVALLLFALEVAVADAAATGNTFDSSVLTSFVVLTNLHHQLPLSFAPIASVGIAYPQGTTAWIATAQLLFGLPPARAALLVTPLFFLLVPPAGYVWGRRTLGTWEGGLAVALVLALLASWTRLLVSGSNDFVLSFPLVLLLWGWAPLWTGPEAPSWGDALLFGALAGYSAALNPSGAELLFPLLPVYALLAPGPRSLRPLRWAGRWAAGLLAAIPWVLPSLSVLWTGRGSPGFVPGATAPGVAGGLPVGHLVGLVDPLLFGPANVWLSPFPALRLELAALIVLGAALVLVPASGAIPRGERRLGAFVLALLVLAVAEFALLTLPPATPPSRFLASVTSAPELSILLFTGYAGLAAIPIARLLRGTWGADPVLEVGGPDRSNASPPPRTAVPSRPWIAWGALAVAGLLLGVGAVVTPLQAPGYLGGIYGEYGNVTAADFDLLAWAGGHLPPGATVLVAPGSAAQFLPGYLPSVHLVYPMAGLRFNATYAKVVSALDRGNLTPTTEAELATLGIGYIAVTQNNTALQAPFDPTPLLADPTAFPVLFHEDDAYLFAVAAGG
jgi:hypothetical protein